MRNSGRLIGFAAASALALVPLAVAAPAWADDEVSGETGAAVATPIGNGNAGGGAGFGVENPFWQPFDASSNAGGGAGVNTPLGGGEFNTATGTDAGFGGAGFDTNTGAAINTPLGGSNFNTGASTDFNVPNPADFIPNFGGGASAGGGAGVNTPFGGSGFNAGASNEFAAPAPADFIPTFGGGTGGGAAVNTPVGGSGFNTGTSGEIGPDDVEIGKLVALSAVRRYPSRIKCALLGWHALMHAIAQDGSGSTETVIPDQEPGR